MFDCSKCGRCCKHINMIPALSEYDIGNGKCKFLTDDNLCAIYQTRPDICNVDKMYEDHFANAMTKEVYYEKNIEGCIALSACE